ncbi:hypothetical protein [Kitasatospora sp. NPDC085464]
MLADPAEAEQEPGRREFLEVFRFSCGLLEEEPEASGQAES